MPSDQTEIHYTATVTHDTGGLFETMKATVDIPVRRAKSQVGTTK